MTLRPGSTNLLVARLQTKLKRFFLGETVEVNGIFNEKTAELISRFQTLHPGESEKGVITEKLLEEVDRALRVSVATFSADNTTPISISAQGGFEEIQADGLVNSLRYLGKTVRKNTSGSPRVVFSGKEPSDFYVLRLKEYITRDEVAAANQSKVTAVKSQFEAVYAKSAGITSPIRVVTPGIPDRFKFEPFDMVGPTVFGTLSSNADAVTESFQKAFLSDRNVRLKIASVNELSQPPVKASSDSRISTSMCTISQLPSWIAGLSVFVSTSFSGVESFAAACGRPTIAIKHGLPDHMLDEQSAFLIENPVCSREKLEDELMAAMAIAASSRENLLTRGLHAAVLASRFSFNQTASDFLRLFSDFGF